MRRELPVWRSLLFVPANVDRFVEKAHLRGADAIILDLEDSIPLEQKEEARLLVPDAAKRVGRLGADVVVRINQPWRLLIRDLETVIGSSVNAICVPKTTSATQLQTICEVIDELELERNLPEGHTQIIALIESCGTIAHLDEIANSTTRLVAMIIGSEDFSASTGTFPSSDNLLFPNQQVVFSARSAGILPLGFIGSIAAYRDLDAFRDTIRRSRHLGLCGGFCVHPDQVSILNDEFSPEECEVREAQSLLDAYNAALKNGRGAASLNGKMIDTPVVSRALELLDRDRKIKQRTLATFKS